MNGHVEVWNKSFKKFLFVVYTKGINGDPNDHSGERNTCVSSQGMDRKSPILPTAWIFVFC